jgi:hypothetical protein
MYTWWIWLIVAIAAFVAGVIHLAICDERYGSDSPWWAWLIGIGLLLVVIGSAIMVIVSGVHSYNDSMHRRQTQERAIAKRGWGRAEQAGLLGQIPVAQIQPPASGATGSINQDAFFYLLGGSASSSGSLSSQNYVQFWWKSVDGDVIPSQLPLDLFKIRIDNSVKSPTVQFVWRHSGRGNTFSSFKANGSTRYSNYIQENNISLVIVRMNQADFDKGVFMRTTGVGPAVTPKQ